MAIDTRIEGNPESVRGVSHWLRASLAACVSDAATQIYHARNRADAGWHGPAGEAFRAKMTAGAERVDEFSTAAISAAQDVDNFAGSLQRAQDEMQYVRERAVAAGLVLNDAIIEPPEPVPETLGTPPTGPAATPAAIASHNSSVAAYNAYATKVAAYETAKTEADAARHIAELGADTLRNAWSTLTQKWFFVLGDLTNGAAGALAAKHSSILRRQSQFLADESTRLLERARAAPATTSLSHVYRDFDLGRAAAHQADDMASAAKAFDENAAKWGFRAGGALAVGGIAYDIVQGKPTAQAIVSGGIGFGASVAAGAAIGTLIPVPVAGTAVGAVGGAVVGIFTSGAVDSLWSNGVGDVGDAIKDGAAAVGDTGAAIGDLAEDAWDAVF